VHVLVTTQGSCMHRTRDTPAQNAQQVLLTGIVCWQEPVGDKRATAAAVADEVGVHVQLDPCGWKLIEGPSKQYGCIHKLTLRISLASPPSVAPCTEYPTKRL